jgi:predicted Zn-ribbon and HTH transcriptional regulator
MVEKLINPSRNVVDLARYQRERKGATLSIRGPMCRHCGAALSDGEREDECSSAFNVDSARLRWQAAQILRGLM